MAKCQPCIAPEVRDFITRTFPDVATAQMLERLPACPDGQALNVCGGRKGGRAPSAYQQFIGQCLRSKKVKAFADAPAKMRECAGEWRARRR